jgi:hypothetical protein
LSVAKQFEKNVENQWKECGKFIYRLYDIVNGLRGQYNIADYIGYKHPNMYCLEMKTCETPSLPRANISDGQYYGLLNAEKYGIVAGLLVWFIKKDVTKFIFAHEYDEIFKTRKSIPHDTEYGITLEGTKKLKYWEYNWARFFEEVENALIQQR